MRRARSGRAALGAALLAGLWAPFPLAAQERGGEPAQDDPAVLSDARDAEIDARAAEIGNRLRCPVCRQQSVTESSSQIAREMQELIREKLRAGESAEEIEAYFVASYGEWILLQPRAEGVNLLVYLLPAAAFLLAGLYLAVRVRRDRRSPAGAGIVGTMDDPEAPGASKAASGSTAAPPSTGSPAPPPHRSASHGRPDSDPAPGEEIDDEDRAWLEAAIREEA
ncbi:MAG: cytochrome c-type biogenesis protein CcmH [Gemmatimonadota bacterium]|nr:cytochrome c-type biogenesis protein CcmH [Gemmatimonadota bacterium]